MVRVLGILLLSALAGCWQPIQYQPGDVNFDGKLTKEDADLILYAVLTGRYIENADVTGDGNITVSDASAVLHLIDEDE